jgi:hypothetical protein
MVRSKKEVRDDYNAEKRRYYANKSSKAALKQMNNGKRIPKIEKTTLHKSRYDWEQIYRKRHGIKAGEKLDDFDKAAIERIRRYERKQQLEKKKNK